MNRRALSIQATGRAALEARQRHARLSGVAVVDEVPPLRVRITERADHAGHPVYVVQPLDGRHGVWATHIVTRSRGSAEVIRERLRWGQEIEPKDWLG